MLKGEKRQYLIENHLIWFQDDAVWKRKSHYITSSSTVSGRMKILLTSRKKSKNPKSILDELKKNTTNSWAIKNNEDWTNILAQISQSLLSGSPRSSKRFFPFLNFFHLKAFQRIFFKASSFPFFYFLEYLSCQKKGFFCFIGWCFAFITPSITNISSYIEVFLHIKVVIEIDKLKIYKWKHLIINYLLY